MNRLRTLTVVAIILLCALAGAAKVSLGFKGEASATVGIYIKDLATGEIVAEHNPTLAISPASVMKTITAASVYSTIDHNQKYETKIYLTGEVSDSICHGNLVVVSSGDPTIDSGNFDERPTLCSEILEAVGGAGIKVIEGRVIVEDTMPDAGCVPQWEIEDVPWGYGAGYYGFNYRDNVFKLYPATKRSEPHVPNLKVIVKPNKYVSLSRGINSDVLTVYGPKSGDPRWSVNTTMNDPASVFAYELTQRLTEGGIRVSGKETKSDNAILLYTHKSPELYDIIHETLVHSHNLFAEALLRLLAPGSTRDDAIEQELKIWSERGLPTEFDDVIDGSGLTRANKLQPQLIGDVLEWMARSQWCDEYVSMLPRVGEEGTVKNFLVDTKLKGQLALKTGSMRSVQCYAGYKLDEIDQHPTHVVVVLVNGFYCQRKDVQTSIANFLLNTFN